MYLLRLADTESISEVIQGSPNQLLHVLRRLSSFELDAQTRGCVLGCALVMFPSYRGNLAVIPFQIWLKRCEYVRQVQSSIEI